MLAVVDADADEHQIFNLHSASLQRWEAKKYKYSVTVLVSILYLSVYFMTTSLIFIPTFPISILH